MLKYYRCFCHCLNVNDVFLVRNTFSRYWCINHSIIISSCKAYLHIITENWKCAKVQCRTVQCRTVQYSTVQYSTVQYSTVQYIYATKFQLQLKILYLACMLGCVHVCLSLMPTLFVIRTTTKYTIIKRNYYCTKYTIIKRNYYKVHNHQEELLQSTQSSSLSPSSHGITRYSVSYILQYYKYHIKLLIIHSISLE